ncbi:hypothetical protein BK126_02965 [Paenibacillus sp. FSL H7-0326]|uniref:hypothetical protein n=1 Tax=Paenibacillus sp. FSL H7-0326 TaxID=1921144 RepID=UPI00096D8247|nr:hypothetical protein [Paenibacillus sp. FSL H7-0326]OMC71088.1 hypothetical protein BK126_02965 [Paenibacillus sp. FSL H7-0326]
MNQAELFTALKSLGMPVAYLAFQSPVQAPFITYHYAYSSDMMADNQNYLDIGNFQVELYATKKDLAAEKLVQDKLKELQMPYSKTETWIEDEKLFQIIYEVQLIGG